MRASGNRRTGVTIVLPTCGRPELLKRSIQSVFAQSVESWQLVVVDDNDSSSVARAETETVMQQYLSDPRVEYLKHASPRGGAAARNSGIRRARSEFIAFLDDDDEWLPEKLDKQLVRFSYASDRTALVYTGFYREFESDLQKRSLVRPRHRGSVLRQVLKRNVIGPTSTIMCRKSALVAIGLFDESLPAKQDVDLYVRLASRFDVDFVGEPLVVLHHHSLPRIGKDLSASVDAHRRYFDKHRELIEADLGVYRYRVISEARVLMRSGRASAAKVRLREALSAYPLSPTLVLLYLVAVFRSLRGTRPAYDS